LAVYKDHLFAARCRLEQLSNNSPPPSTPSRELAKVYTYRQARIWASVTGIAGFLLLVFDVLGGPRYSTHILLLTWLGVGVVYLLALGAARFHLQRVVSRAGRSTGDVFRDLAWLEAGGATREIAIRTHRLERVSLALPLALLSLLAPLTLHFLFSLVFLETDLQAFGGWIVISLVIVGHAHVTLLVLAVLHVLRLRRELDRGLPVAGASRGFKALLWTTLASTMPGLFLLCIPPPLVFVTGVVFVPWAFAWAAHRAHVERLCLGAQGLETAQ
jgi:hypothetical protein